MNILCVHQGSELYGSDKTFVQSVRAFKNGNPGCKITVSLPESGDLSELLVPYVDEIVYGDVFVLRKSTAKRIFGSDFFLLIRGVLSAYRRMRNYDFVYINTVVVLNFILASFFSGSRSVVHVHEIPVGLQKIFFSILLFFSRSKKVFNSFATKQSYLFPSAESLVISNGVPDFSGGSHLRKLSDDPLKILLVGRLNSWKGQDLLVDAISRLDDFHKSQIEVKIIGGVFGDQVQFKENLKSMINLNRLSHCVEHIDFVRDVHPYYEWCDVVVVPSKKPEPFGLVAIEAMSHGRAVLAAAHGGLLDIVDHGITGLLFKPGSSDDLSFGLKALLSDRASTLNMGCLGYERFIAFFEERKYIECISKLPCLI